LKVNSNVQKISETIRARFSACLDKTAAREYNGQMYEPSVNSATDRLTGVI
jgi:hypothetical protein